MNSKAPTLIQFLRDEQKVLRGLVSQVSALDSRNREMERGVVRELMARLEIYLRIEDEFFRPLFSSLNEENARLADEDLSVDQRAIREASWRVSEERARGEAFDELIESLELHFERAESELFPVAESVALGYLEELGGKAAERSRELMKSPALPDAAPERAQNPSGGEQKRKAVA